MSIQEIADSLEGAQRMGAEKDEPEGARYIRISDTLAVQIAQYLRAEQPAVHVFCEVCGKAQEIKPIHATMDKLNALPWADLICASCHFVIGTIVTAEPGLYKLMRVSD